MADFSSSLAAYEQVEANFKQQKAAELFLQKLMSSDPEALLTKTSGAGSEEKEAADKMWSELRKEVDTCRKISDRLDKENDRVINKVKDFDMNAIKVKYGKVNYAERVQAMEEELRRVQQEQQAMANLTAERSARQQQLVQELDEAEQEAEESVEEKEQVDPALIAETARLRALVGGIEALTSIHVNSMKYNGASELIMSITIHGVSVLFGLAAADRKLNSIMIESYPANARAIDTASLLAECSVLPAPQDLRLAVFHIGAAQTSLPVLQSHVVELRKKSLVSGDAKSGALDVTCSNGVTLRLAVHPCYSFVSKSVQIASIVGLGSWGADTLASVKQQVNSNPSSSSSLLAIVDAVKAMLQ